MRADLVTLLRCPRCDRETLRLRPMKLEQITYRSGPVEEVREGAVECACGLSLPVEDYVLSYDALMPEGVKADGRYWGSFYRFALSHGIKGHFDLEEGFPPLLAKGVFETSPQPPGERHGPHAFMAVHPLLRDCRSVLDIGCGAGWSSLFLARRGFDVVAIDPSPDVVRLAKQYAITAGVFVEYICAGLGFIRFREEAFDAAYALHSLHHIPDLAGRTEEVHRLLKTGGCLCVDDHHQRNDQADRLAAALTRWVDAAVVPKYRVQDPVVMASFPPGGSAHEDVSLGETLAQAQRFFHIRYLDTRYTFLDMLSTAYYLHHGQSRAAFEHAEELVGLLYQAWREAYPEGVEYVTFIGQKERERPKFQLALALDVSQPVGEVPVGELVAGRPVDQPFRTRRDHLAAIEVQLATYGRANTGEVTFRLREARSGREVVAQRFHAAEVVNNAFRRFEFEPLAGSKDRRYVISLEAPGGRPGDAITAWASAAPVARFDQWEANGMRGGGTLAFRAFCARPVSDLRNPQKSLLQRVAYLYWYGGLPEVWTRVRGRLGRVLGR